MTFRHVSEASAQSGYGLSFDVLETRSYFALADLMYGEADALSRFLNQRRRHKSLLAGVSEFLWWGVSEPWRALSYALAPKTISAPAKPAPLQPQPIGALQRMVEVASQQIGVGGQLASGQSFRSL